MIFLDNCGLLSVDNLRKACVESEFHLTESELKEMIQEV